jgi:hypothetical protein
MFYILLTSHELKALFFAQERGYIGEFFLNTTIPDMPILTEEGEVYQCSLNESDLYEWVDTLTTDCTLFSCLSVDLSRKLHKLMYQLLV